MMWKAVKMARAVIPSMLRLIKIRAYCSHILKVLAVLQNNAFQVAFSSKIKCKIAELAAIQ